MPNQADKTLDQIRTESSSAIGETTRRDEMTTDKIAQNMEVIGADGVHVGTVANGRIRLGEARQRRGPAQGPRAFHRPWTCRRRRGAEDSPFCECGCGRDIRGRAVRKARLKKGAR